MQRIEFSAVTHRLRRNLMASAFLLLVITVFDIQIGKATASGFELRNLTTEVVILLLIAIIFYHMVAFSIRAFEEYRLWELKLADKQATTFGGGPTIVNLADKMIGASESFDAILKNGGAISHANQDVFTERDAKNLNQVATAAQTYAKRFENFPKITRFRFWFWDIGAAATLAIVAILVGFEQLPIPTFDCSI